MSTFRHRERALYMHKETFDIEIVLTDCVDCADYTNENKGAYIQIDELIALPVQILNRKGYITEICCAGHLSGSDTLANGIFKLDGDTSRFGASTIRFKEGISLPSIPLGFVSVDNGFYKAYDNNNVYELLREQLEAMEQLYKWALDLPEFKG